MIDWFISQAVKCDILAVSTDSEFSHYNWTKTPRSWECDN